MTRLLVVGSGAREHALAWKLRQSPRVSALFVAPGNGGTPDIAENVAVPANDVSGLLRAAQDRHVDLVVVGPEEPLALGLADAFRAANIACVGPTRAAARIEASKGFAKGLMERARIPTARSRTFDDFAEAKGYVEAQPLPVVVKADGLAAGKGVAVCPSREEAVAFLHEVMVHRAFGGAGERVVVEECLTGTEASAFAFTDGRHLLLTVPACDYKRVFDGDRGPNTGGMGAYSPPEFLTRRDEEEVRTRVLEPAVRQMAAEGTPFQGFLYAGLMVGPTGFKVLEFNCRLGDPETQVVLPRLRSDLLDLLEAIAEGNVARAKADWDPQPCVGVVVAAPGYPGDYPKGLPIAGLEDIARDVLVFHAGTRRDERGQVLTNGGRVLTVVALGDTMEQARRKVYDNVACIAFPGMHYRRDIALRAIQATARPRSL
ncbi:MAG: phosphoribosylamine--glycine ligase [Chloroflexi bacterium]|nr:phosphoribosylamine--glycine ligase [Chloroflexota bacterium]